MVRSVHRQLEMTIALFLAFRHLQNCLAGGKFFFDPSKLLLPSSEEEVVSIVNWARINGRRLRVLGAGHSRSPLAVSEDLLLSLHNLRGVVRVDTEQKLVTVKGGTTLKELVQALHEHGLALDNLPAIVDQTVPGALVTGGEREETEVGREGERKSEV